jgi:phosphoglycolate phosphatase
VRNIIGDGAQATITRALEVTGHATSEDELNAILAAYLDRYRHFPVEHTKPFPGVTSVLENFRNAGIPMGICTNKPSATTRQVLDALGLSPFFSAVICGDTISHPKPDGRHVLAVLDAIGGNRFTAVFVGDSHQDITAARAAGIASIAARYGYNASPIQIADADIAINSFIELPIALGLLAKMRGAH